MINWKLRMMNKTTLVSLVLAVVAFVYQTLGLFGIVPAVSQDEVINLVGIIINILVALGVVVDPTTAGVSDSSAALNYTAPKEDKEA